MLVMVGESDVGDSLYMMYVVFKYDSGVVLKVDTGLLEGSEMHKQKVLHRLSHPNTITTLSSLITPEISDLSTSTAFNAVNYLHLLYLKVCWDQNIMTWDQTFQLLKYVNRLLSGSEADLLESENIGGDVIDDYISDLNEFTKLYNMQHWLDIFSILVSS